MTNSFMEIVLSYVQYHAISLIAITIIIMAIIIHNWGSNYNYNLALQYSKQISPLLKGWFKKCDDQLIVQSPHIVKMYPSGRQSCLFAIIAFAMVTRQQLLSFFFNWIIFQNRDEFVVEIPIANENPIPITLAVIRKKQIRTITKKSYPDIKHLCKQYRPTSAEAYNVPPTHSILVEKVDHVKYLLANAKEVALWQQVGKSVKFLYLSNQNKFSRYPMAVRMVVNLGPQIVPMLEWLMGFVDRMSALKIGSVDRKDALKRREGLQINYD